MSDLALLLREMRPVLHAEPYAIESHGESHSTAWTGGAPAHAFATVREAEGLTVIAPAAHGEWARISLSVHSSLSAVGLTAAMARVLAAGGISCNVVAGFHHDHLFVPWGRRHDAMDALATLSNP